MKAKHQRLTLALLALVALVGAGLLGAYALQDQASYFYTPSDIVEKKPEAGTAIRLGGMVEEGSIERSADGVTVHFIVQDGTARQKVTYTGITPDLFVEGSGDGAVSTRAGAVARLAELEQDKALDGFNKKPSHG